MEGSRNALLVAMTVAIVLATEPGRDSAVSLLLLVGLATVLAVALRWPLTLTPVAIVVLAVVGVALRVLTSSPGGSDVLDVVVGAIRHVEAGGNPYGIGFDVSRPPGAPYAYGPLGLLWYVPFTDEPWRAEILASSVVLVLLALRGRLLGLAIYALAPTLIQTTSDGANDNSVGLLLLLAFAIAPRRPIGGAILLAAAVALKPYAAAWAPAFLVWASGPAAVTFLVASAILWSPVLLVWGVPSFLKSLQLANEVHGSPYWSLASVYQLFTHRTANRELFDLFRLALGAFTALLSLPFVRATRSLDVVILTGSIVFAATLFGGYWSSFAYFGALAPVLCWRIDDWLGLESAPLLSLGSARPEAREPQLARDPEAAV